MPRSCKKSRQEFRSCRPLLCHRQPTQAYLVELTTIDVPEMIWACAGSAISMMNGNRCFPFDGDASFSEGVPASHLIPVRPAGRSPHSGHSLCSESTCRRSSGGIEQPPLRGRRCQELSALGKGIERLASEKASSADRLFSGDHDYAASPNIPSAPLRCAWSNPYALDEYRVPTGCNRRFLEIGNPSSPREKLSPPRAKAERSA
jgi:hypothetical protein